MKRWLICIILCLILGAITTVAVAWGCAYWGLDQAWTRANYYRGDRGEERIISPREEALLQRLALKPSALDELQSMMGPSEVLSEVRAEMETHLNPAGKLDLALLRGKTTSGDEGTVLMFIVFSTGYPSRSMNGLIYWHWSGGDGRRGYEDGYEVMKDGATSRNIVAIPLAPIWPGFLIDTLFYAAIWFGVFFGVTSAKRFIRIKRGRCPRCGYDLRGALDNGCSECGWGREGSGT